MDALPAPIAPDFFVHVRIILSIVVGFGLTRLLALGGRLVQHPGRPPVYWVHLVWVVSLFITLIEFWWWEFSLAGQAWRFETYTFVIVYASLYYFLAVLLAPEDVDDYPDYAVYFLSRRQWFFGLLAFATLMDVVDTAIKGRSHFEALGAVYLVQTVVTAGLAAVAAFTSSRRFHALFAVANLAWEIIYIVQLYDPVG